tara:strand:+ start:853 stop:1458 length:606 start_codon:yes stop_codon:yes gene_type:complete
MNLDPKILLAGMAVSLISIFPFNATFYIFTRTIICLSFLYGTYELNKKNHGLWIPLFMLAILYNPVAPIYFDSKFIWSIIDIVSAIIFLYSYLICSPSYNLERLIQILGRVIALGGYSFSLVIGYFVVREYIDEGLEPIQAVLNSNNQAFLPIVFATLIFATMWNYIFFKKFTPWLSEIDDRDLEKQRKAKYGKSYYHFHK